MPVYTFGDISMDGEHPMIWVPSFHDYNSFYNPPQSRGYIHGRAMGLVGTMMYHGNTGPKGPGSEPLIYRKVRGYLACTLPYGVVPMAGAQRVELDRVQNLRAALGVLDNGIEDLYMGDRFGRPELKVVPDELCFHAELNRKRGRGLLYANSFTSARTGTSRFDVAGLLTGLDLGAGEVHAWNPENGASLRVGGRWVFDKLPEDFGMVWVERRPAAQPSRPDGAILGVSFDKGLEADFGGGLVPAAVRPGRPAPKTIDGAAGKALAFGPYEAAVEYPVVPSWVAGAAEFDLQVRRDGDHPVRLLGLKHHLDAELFYAKDKGRPGLLLVTREFRRPADAAAQVPDADRLERKFFAPLPGGPAESWHRVAVVWRSGQYALHINGKPVARMFTPAAMRIRDAVPMAAGVLVGDGSATAAARGAELALDSLIVYDHALDARAVASFADRPGLTAAARPAGGDTFPVWVLGKAGREATALIVGTNLTGMRNWPAVLKVRATLFDPRDPKTPLAKAEFAPWLGAGLAELAPTAAAAKLPGKSGPTDVLNDPLSDSDTGPLPTLDAGRTFLLKVELLAAKDALTAARTVRVHAGGIKEPTGEY